MDAGDQRAIMLSREELRYLMALMGAEAMIGLEAAEDDPAVSRAGGEQSAINRGRTSLIDRGLVIPGCAGREDEVDDRLRRLAVTSLFPDGAALIVRDLPEIGKQVLVLFRRGASAVLHTFPEPFSHRLAPLDDPRQAVDLILRWFPLQVYPGDDCRVLLEVERFEELRGKAEAGQEEAALQVLAGCPLADGDSLSLIRAIENRVISGSLAALQCTEDEITAAYSVAVVADRSTAWLLSQPEDDRQASHLLVRRIGPDFPLTVIDLIQRM